MDKTLEKAKGAHDALIAAAHRAQADALLIESQAKRRLADEYDAAQERGEIATRVTNLRHGPDVPKENIGTPTTSDLGISRKEIHEARIIRDAEAEDPSEWVGRQSAERRQTGPARYSRRE